MSSYPSRRTRIRRAPERAQYDQETLYQIIDAAYLCHIAFYDGTSTHCIPTACWRSGEHLYIHGSNGGRLMKLLAKGVEASVAITHLDGLVLARSAFNHSMNYRSAVIYGQFEQVIAEVDKSAALDALMDKIASGRKDEVRPGNSKEIGATIVLRVSLSEAAAKVRSGGPMDDEKDMQIGVWAGVLPLEQVQTTPEPEGKYSVIPAYVREWGGSWPVICSAALAGLGLGSS
ncbi:pyridoxamine 5'-phosphate oxidase family protein [Janthinobacterium sp. B9-8]|uniref:pyridoxamine 5'-phosphate oxidase family protein n=1 Tax=Janthinobacterium sp. B9-8 TaxID=1236179 RepID=UPI00061D2B51|nr:pyridoxamine 5'-phosphate oxidase family protein [Janthinobacterium sp. B9-8]AMC35541.1 flavin-nucleotide-binding protein [Janthinobacterium sp. B9-8]